MVDSLKHTLVLKQAFLFMLCPDTQTLVGENTFCDRTAVLEVLREVILELLMFMR